MQRGVVLGLMAGSVLSCSSTAGERTDASQSVSTSDASPDVAIVDSPDGAIVDAEIDICSSLPGSCSSPMPTDAAADAPVVDPNQCPSLATYCPQQSSNGDPTLSSRPSCAPVETWPEAVAYSCIYTYATGRYLNCNGYNMMAVGSVEFSTVFYFDSTTLALVAIAGAVPLAYEVFRMGYYGLLVPNTAVAKEASHVRFHQGLVYLADFASPYHLWIPLAVLLVLFLLTGQHLSRAGAVRCAAAAGSGLLMALYVIAIGGDFMHARMLLAPVFTLLLPVMLVPVPKPRAGLANASLSLLVAITGVWAAGAGLRWRDPTPLGIIPGSGIANERGFWSVHTGQQNPDNAAEYVLTGMGSPDVTGSLEWMVSRDARSGRAVLLYQATQWSPYVSVPLSRPRYPVAVAAYILGTGGAGTPLDGLVVDMHGLSYALGSHLVGDPDGRPGHSKWVNPAWVVAEYSDVTQAPGIPPAQLSAARKALSCGPLAELDQATGAPLTPGRFAANFFHALTLTTFRFSPDPVTAERELCR